MGLTALDHLDMMICGISIQFTILNDKKVDFQLTTCVKRQEWLHEVRN